MSITIQIDGRNIETTDERIAAATTSDGNIRRGHTGSVAGDGLLCIISQGQVWLGNGMVRRPRLYSSPADAQQALAAFHARFPGVGQIAIACF